MLTPRGYLLCAKCTRIALHKYIAEPSRRFIYVIVSKSINSYLSRLSFQIQIQKNFIATQDNVFYVQSQRMLQYIFLSQTYPSTYITWVIQVLTHCCQDKRSPPLDDILKCIFLSQTYPSTYIIWVIQVLTHCCRDKATAAPRRHSHMHLPEWKYVDFGQNSTETHPQGPNQQHSSIGADIGLVPNGRKATIWTNDDYFNDAYKRHSTLMSQHWESTTSYDNAFRTTTDYLFCNVYIVVVDDLGTEEASTLTAMDGTDISCGCFKVLQTETIANIIQIADVLYWFIA